MEAKARTSESGFTLVEILVVTVIMGLVMTSVFSLYLTQQRTANTSDEVIDVQQNLRIAYDMMARDIRMAGFGHANPIAAAEGDRLEIRTPSPFNRYARMVSVHPDSSGAPDTANEVTDTLDADGTVYFIKIPVSQAQSLRKDNLFRVLRPQRGLAYWPGTETTTIGNIPLLQATADPYLEGGEYYLPVKVYDAALTDFSAGEMGDFLARVPGDTATPDSDYNPYPDPGHTLAFELADDPGSADPNQKRLMRVIYDAAGAAVESQVLAAKVVDDPADADDGLRFEYLVMDGDGDVTLAATQVGESVSDYGAAENQVVTIQLRLTGGTDVTATGNAQMSGVKTREVLGRIQLKNRKIVIGGI